MARERATPALGELTAALDQAHTLEDASRIAVLFAEARLDSDVTGLVSHDVLGVSTPLAASSPVVAQLHAEWNRLGGGPKAPPSGSVLTVADTRTDERWPAWSRAAAGLGVLSLRQLGLGSLGGRSASLDLYSRRADAFGSDDLDRDTAGAAHIGLALRLIERIANLEEGLRTRELIGQAQGIAMERHGLTAAQAMEFLRRASQHTQTKVRDLAIELIASSSSPTDVEQGVTGAQTPRSPA